MKRTTILLLILILLFSTNTFAQQLKYRDIKNAYTTKNYRDKIEDPNYSPLITCVFNFFTPLASYYYLDETVRGVCVFGGQMIASAASIYGCVIVMNSTPHPKLSNDNARTIIASGLIVSSAIYLWSFFDVVKIAKIKNLAYQNNENKLSLKISPDLNFISMKNSYSPVAELRMSIAF